VIHDAFDRDMAPIPFGAAQRAQAGGEALRGKGWKPVVAPEMEFFLVARNLDPAKPIEPMMGRSGRRRPRGRPIR
jgi:glutamine synthetase